MTAPTVHGSVYTTAVSYSSNIAITGVTTTAADVQLFLFAVGGQGNAFTGVTGGGLTWTELDTGFHSSSASAHSAIWTARASSTIASQTITASRSGPSSGKAWIIMFEGCPDYATLTKNTDYEVDKTQTNEDTGLVSVSLTTIAADSLLYGVYTSWDNTATLTEATGTTIVSQSNSASQNAALVRHTDNPLAIGTYSLGITNSTGGSWRSTIIHGIEILGSSGGSSSVLTSAGGATPSLVGAKTQAGVVTSAGVATGSFQGAKLETTVMQSAGVASTSLVASRQQRGTLTSAGVAAASFAASVADSSFAMTGVGAVSFAGASLVEGALTSVAEGSANFVALTGSSAFSSAGEASVSFASAHLQQGTLSADGVGEATFAVSWAQQGSPSVVGEASVGFQGLWALLANLEADGVADASFVGDYLTASSEITLDGTATVLFGGSRLQHGVLGSAGQAQFLAISATLDLIWREDTALGGSWVVQSGAGNAWTPGTEVSNTWTKEDAIDVT